MGAQTGRPFAHGAPRQRGLVAALHLGALAASKAVICPLPAVAGKPSCGAVSTNRGRGASCAIQPAQGLAGS